MPDVYRASRAYASASINRTVRQQEADLFLLVLARLHAARQAGHLARIRALADNRRLWAAILDVLRDCDNLLPEDTRAGLLSIGRYVQREMDSDDPNFDFLVLINKNIAEGLLGNP